MPGELFESIKGGMCDHYRSERMVVGWFLARAGGVLPLLDLLLTFFFFLPFLLFDSWYAGFVSVDVGNLGAGFVAPGVKGG